MAISFKGTHFPTAVILMGVCWSVAYPLRTRHVEVRMAERGVSVDHSTINRWVITYSPQADTMIPAYPVSSYPPGALGLYAKRER